MRRLVLFSCVAMCVGFSAFANDEVDPAQKALPDHQLILTEVGGGTDSSVSPDGKWLAFSSRRSGNLDIWTANIETGALRQITFHPDTDNEPRWHPDGTHLCFVTQRDGSQDVYIVDLATGEETPIATEDFNEDYPSYAKDGSEICFTGGPRGYREVQVYNFETGKIRTLTRGYGYVGSTNFSPDGKRLVFHAYYDNSYLSGKSDVFTVSSQGGDVTNITNDRDNWDYKPNWSFDGDWITFSAKRDTENFNLYVMRTDGSELHAVTRVIGPDLRWSNWTKDGRIGWHQVNAQEGALRAINLGDGSVSDVFTSEFNVNDFAISPSGKQILFESDARVFVMDLDPSAAPREIGRGLEPRWNRDGTSVSMLVNWRSKVAVIPLGEGEHRILDVKPADWPAVTTGGVSPDGMKLAAIVEQENGHSLTVVGEDGEVKVVVESGASLGAPAWSPDGQWVLYTENTPPSVSYFISKVALNNSGS